METLQSKSKITRRRFLKWFVGGVALAELSWVIWGLTGKNKTKQNTVDYFNAGSVNFFENGRVYPYTGGRFYLSRLADGGFLAISAKCTHLGCMVQPSSEKEGFSCPCHASKFSNVGEVLSPPAVRALDIFPIKIERGEILVDTNHPIKRTAFNSKQITYS